MKKVLITGAAGFIGSHLCDRLLDEGVEVVGVDDLSHGALENITGCLMHPAFTFHQMDCSKPMALQSAAAGCDAIVHLAALKIPRYGNALATLEQNIAGMRAAADVSLALDVDLVGGVDLRRLRQRRGALQGGRSARSRPAYLAPMGDAVSKLYDEHMCLALAEERGLRVSILRLFGSYLPRNHPSWWGWTAVRVHRGAARRQDDGDPR